MLLTLDGNGPRYAQITRALRAMIQERRAAVRRAPAGRRATWRAISAARETSCCWLTNSWYSKAISSRVRAPVRSCRRRCRASRDQTRASSQRRPPDAVRLSQRGRPHVDAFARARPRLMPRARGCRSTSCTGCASPIRESWRACARRSTRRCGRAPFAMVRRPAIPSCASRSPTGSERRAASRARPTRSW